MMLVEVQNAETPIFINMKRKQKKTVLRLTGLEILH